MVYLVTWDLNKEGANYTRSKAVLDSALDKLVTIKDPNLRTVRFVSTTWLANELYNYLAPHIDKNDRIIVTKIDTGNHQGWMHPDVWGWINNRL